jgi:probable F420-dependent oxidoreductase
MPRPFRFGASLLTSAPAGEWRARCRRVEELGYDVILVPDHLGMVAPFPALVAAAEATERPRVGTFVLNAGFWNPTLLAREVTTTNDLTGGRLELGLGTGYVQAEHDTAGLPFGSPRERVDHLRYTVQELERLLDAAECRVPLLLGGNGDRMLRLTAEHADIAAFTGAHLVQGNTEGKLAPVDAIEFGQRVARYREFAADRAEPAELNLLIQLVAVTDDPASALRPCWTAARTSPWTRSSTSRSCWSAPWTTSPRSCARCATGTDSPISPCWSRTWRRSRRSSRNCPAGASRRTRTSPVRRSTRPSGARGCPPTPLPGSRR